MGNVNSAEYENTNDYQPPAQSEITRYSSTGFQDPGLVRWQLDPDDILDELRHDLRGDVFDPTQKEWLEGGSESRLMNENGIRVVINFVRTHICKNNTLSNFNERDVEVICTDLHIDFAEWLVTGQGIYEIKTENLDLIIDIVMDTIYAAYKRALGQGERMFLKAVEPHVERRISSSGQEQKKSWIPFVR